MENSGILLNDHFTNILKIGGETAWFMQDTQAGTPYTWRFRPDNSGVYELQEEILLHASTNAVGVTGTRIWKFNPIRKGEGWMRFELYRPNDDNPIKTLQVYVQVQ